MQVVLNNAPKLKFLQDLVDGQVFCTWPDTKNGLTAYFIKTRQRTANDITGVDLVTGEMCDFSKKALVRFFPDAHVIVDPEKPA